MLKRPYGVNYLKAGGIVNIALAAFNTLFCIIVLFGGTMLRDLISSTMPQEIAVNSMPVAMLSLPIAHLGMIFLFDGLYTAFIGIMAIKYCRRLDKTEFFKPLAVVYMGWAFVFVFALVPLHLNTFPIFGIFDFVHKIVPCIIILVGSKKNKDFRIKHEGEIHG